MERQALACETLAVSRQVNAAYLPPVSMALAEAQQELERLRLAYRPNQIERQIQTRDELGRSQSPKVQHLHETRPNSFPDQVGNFLGDHLGWHSAPATRAYRVALKNQERPSTPTPPQPITNHQSTNHPTHHPPSTTHQPPPNNQQPHIKLPPDIALAILRHKLAAPGRIWLLLRHLDIEGQGWLAADMVREKLTGKTSNTAVCGPRQLRNLLAAGDGIFWQRDDGRIWLRSMAKVAAALGLKRLNGRSVKLPLSILLKSIGTIRAHLYATFHSGRQKTAEDRGSKPISRETLKTLSSATRRTQRLYEKRVGLKPKANYAIGRPHSVEAAQNMAWKQGTAVFQFQDQKGFVGPAGRQYVAWQLPNSYSGPHDVLSRSYQRQINRQLADLLNEGITGNGENTGGYKAAEGDGELKRPMFYQSGAKAARKFNRTPEQDYYWRGRTKERFNLWHHLPAVNKGKNGR